MKPVAELAASTPQLPNSSDPAAESSQPESTVRPPPIPPRERKNWVAEHGYPILGLVVAVAALLLGYLTYRATISADQRMAPVNRVVGYQNPNPGRVPKIPIGAGVIQPSLPRAQAQSASDTTGRSEPAPHRVSRSLLTPDEQLAHANYELESIGKHIYFEIGSPTMDAPGIRTVKAWARLLLKYPALRAKLNAYDRANVTGR